MRADLAARARRLYWLNPEPQAEWGQEDSLIEQYRRSCTAVYECRTLGQLAEAVAGQSVTLTLADVNNSGPVTVGLSGPGSALGSTQIRVVDAVYHLYNPLVVRP